MVRKGGGHKNRGRVDILASVVEVALEPTRKTRIMYGCNLSFEQLQLYLEESERYGFIKSIDLDGEGPHLVATDKGREYLDAYRRVMAMIENTEPQRLEREQEVMQVF